MTRAWGVVVAVLLITAVLLVSHLLMGMFIPAAGFEEDDLRTPRIEVVERQGEPPGPLGLLLFPADLRSGVRYVPTVYADYGGIVELLVENKGHNDLYVPQYSVGWEGSSVTYTLNCSRTVASGEAQELGVLHFPGPGGPGPATLRVTMGLWSSSANGENWWDRGELLVTSIDFDVVQEDALREWEVQTNPLNYYNKVNRLVDFEVVQGMAQQVRQEAPGNYSLLQVIKAYELVLSEIEYLTDEDNRWQSPAETLELGTGDCEDHSLLLASLITALGGSARVNVIPGHAFATVYLGNASTADLAVEAIQAYYGNAVPVHWTADGSGHWLVIDTNGVPYVGGYPASASPAGGVGGVNWHFEDGDWIRTMDVTGETEFSLFF
jgi:hypothetical protein